MGMTNSQFSPFGVDLFGEPIVPEGRGPLVQRFSFPPFTVLNARDGDWMERKRAWISYGIRSEVGRSAKSFHVGEWMEQNGGGARGDEQGVSIFDPVLTELCYRWFCPPGGQIVDPFAGGSVRGVVAGLLGYRYHGIDLRAEQIEENRNQLAAICPAAAVTWSIGDCRVALADAPPADFIFTCPPYGDLERYSDDPADLSTLDYRQFMKAIHDVANHVYQVLRPNRLAAIVVGDFRGPNGYYRGFPADTTAAFRAAGFGLYNEAVLVTAVGSLPVRVSAQFDSGRKLGKTHQNVLIFGKGDPRKAFAG